MGRHAGLGLTATSAGEWDHLQTGRYDEHSGGSCKETGSGDGSAKGQELGLANFPKAQEWKIGMIVAVYDRPYAAAGSLRGSLLCMLISPDALRDS